MDFKLYAIRVFCLKWEESLPFYRDLLELPTTFCDENMGWAQFSLGGADLGLERADPNDPETADLVGRFVGISLQVGDIKAAYEELSGKGVDFVGPPVEQPWGGSLAHFRDPDGNVLTLLGDCPTTSEQLIRPQ